MAVRLTGLLAGLCVALAACVWVPAPNRALLNLTVAAPEWSPYLTAFHVLAAAFALRFRRGLLAVIALSSIAVAWPMLELPGVERSVTAQMRTPRPRDLGMRRYAVSEPERLPLGMLCYRPAGGAARPALVDLYAGAWQRGQPADDDRFARQMAERGWVVFAIDYRHVPAARFPAQLDDVRAALNFLHDHAREYGADPARVALCGRSSGGELALVAAYTPGAAVAAVVGIYAPIDLARGYRELPWPDPIDVRGVLAAYLGGSPDETPDRYLAASPMAQVRAGLPPTLLLQGTRDHVVKPEFPRALHHALQAAGNRSVLVELPWAEHSFDAVPGGLGERVALEATEWFLREAVPQ